LWLFAQIACLADQSAGRPERGRHWAGRL